jgi:hypothetical protein
MRFEHSASCYIGLDQKLTDTERRLAIAVGALQWYADEANYREGVCYKGSYEPVHDCGDMARDALSVIDRP